MSFKVKRHWLKFWKIESFEVTLPTVYYVTLDNDVYNDVYNDIRDRLSNYLIDSVGFRDMVSKSESCYVIYDTYDQYITHDIKIRFWVVDNEILLETDKSVKRELVLEELGI